MATAAQIREHYDSLALIYRTFWGDHIHHGLFETGDESPEHAQVRMLDHCSRLIRPMSGNKVLDVGCGHGGTLVYLATKFGCRGTGLTLSPKQARIARENAAKAGLANQINFDTADADTFQFPGAAFDIVWAMESTEHFADKPKFFRNAGLALHPGGRLLLAAWTGSMDRPSVREVARAFLCPELWTAAEYQSAIELGGMKVEHSQDLTASVLHTWEICQRRARTAAPVVKLLPRAAREFVEGIDVILDAYRSGDLTYTVITGVR